MAEPQQVGGKVIIGLTGNIATGKSVVLRLAAQHGALVIDADRLVHEILDEDKAVQEQIAGVFGAAVRREDGRIDRTALGNIVFADPQALQELERIVHPVVGRRVREVIAASDAAVVFIEAIKLLEGRLRALCDQIWVTNCSREQQLERLRVCRGMDARTAAARVDAQPPQQEKVTQADVVIDTGGLLRDTERQFAAAWAALPGAD